MCIYDKKYDLQSDFLILLNDYVKLSADLRFKGRYGGDHMIVGFTTTCAINAYHH